MWHQVWGQLKEWTEVTEIGGTWHRDFGTMNGTRQGRGHDFGTIQGPDPGDRDGQDGDVAPEFWDNSGTRQR